MSDSNMTDNMPLDKPSPPQTPKGWLELAKKDAQKAQELWQSLEFSQRLSTVLAAELEDREALLTLAGDAKQLVRSLAPDDFVQSVLAVGAEDAGTLISLSSNKQITFLTDLTSWVDNRFAPSRTEMWLPLLMDAGSNRITSWLKSSDLEMLSLLFAHWFKVVKWVASQDEQEPPDDLPGFTLDGVYFLEFHNQKTAGFVAQVLVALKSEEPQRYLDVLETMIWEPAAQLAEYGLRWRNNRLADAGFPERMEALELWAKPAPGEENWRNLPDKTDLGFPAKVRPHSDPVAGRLPNNSLLPTLSNRLKPEAREGLGIELAYVANCGVAALGVDPADPKAVSRAASETLSLVNLGLELLSRDNQAEATQILAKLPLPVLSRKAAYEVRRLNLRAWVLVREGWLKELTTGWHLFEPPLDRIVAGLLFPQPRCYDPKLGEDREYRAFRTLADLEQARRALDQAEFWGHMLHELLGITPEEFTGLFQAEIWPEDPEEIKLSAVLGTWLARRALGLEGLTPLAEDQLVPAVKALQKDLDGPLARELNESCRALPDPAQAAMAGQMIRPILNRLSLELSRLNPEAGLDPAFIYGLIVER
jgi:hypothetical protein